MKTHLIMFFLFTLILSTPFSSFAAKGEQPSNVNHYNEEDPNVSQPLPEKEETEANPVVSGENCNCKKNASPVARFADTDARKSLNQHNSGLESPVNSNKGVND
jgi:hypothetical protein